jgi:hypothetical protein
MHEIAIVYSRLHAIGKAKERSLLDAAELRVSSSMARMKRL